MDKIERDILSAASDIARICISVTNLTPHDAFAYYEAHVNQISVNLFKNGWSSEAKPKKYEVYLIPDKNYYFGLSGESKRQKECKLKLKELNRIKKELSALIEI